MRVVCWGTWDLDRPRNRILIRGLRDNGIEVVICHRNVWGGIEDKSRLSRLGRLRSLLRLLVAYPALVVRYLRLPRHDVVLVNYLGQLDVLVLWPFGRLRGVPVVWNAFLSLHDTVVSDRHLLSHRHALARLLFAVEWLGARACARVVLDTRVHAGHFARMFGLPIERTSAVFVGAEPEAFPLPATSSRAFSPIRVLFYGQLIPLHGVTTIVEAARAVRDEDFEWTLIGRGQDEDIVRRMLDAEPLARLRWIPWVPYTELARFIHEADVCLGIFGAGGKAGRVIPNKVFQAIACGKPLITRDSPAIRELVVEEGEVYLVPAADPQALVAALRRFGQGRGAPRDAAALHTVLRQRIHPSAIGHDLTAVLRDVVASGTRAN